MNRLLIATGAAFLAGTATFAIAQPTDFAGMPTTRVAALAALRARFAAIDADKDGFVTRAELPTPPGMAMVGGGGPEMLFDEIDKDKNGQISRAEFDAFRSRPNRMAMADGGEPRRMSRRDGPGGPMRGMGGMPGPALGLGMMFDRVDTNHDGKLSAAEAETAALARFDRVDDNHDGIISPEERQAHAPRRMAMRWHQERFDRPDRMPPPPPPVQQ